MFRPCYAGSFGARSALSFTSARPICAFAVLFVQLLGGAPNALI
jgi:hypothetical protein